MITRTAFDILYEALQSYEVKPYAIMMGRRDWREVVSDPRARPHVQSVPGDPDTFCRVPVRIEGRRMVRNQFQPRIFTTAEDLHEALYDGTQRRKRRRH